MLLGALLDPLLAQLAAVREWQWLGPRNAVSMTYVRPTNRHAAIRVPLTRAAPDENPPTEVHRAATALMIGTHESATALQARIQPVEHECSLPEERRRCVGFAVARARICERALSGGEWSGRRQRLPVSRSGGQSLTLRIFCLSTQAYFVPTIRAIGMRGLSVNLAWNRNASGRNSRFATDLPQPSAVPTKRLDADKTTCEGDFGRRRNRNKQHSGRSGVSRLVNYFPEADFCATVPPRFRDVGGS
jgi:hypothetical protein